MGTRERDLELLLPVSAPPLSVANGSSKPSSPSAPSPSSSSSVPFHHSSSKEACCKVLHSWATKKFMSGSVILLPLAVTFYITWWFIQKVDDVFSPIYRHLGLNFFGLGFMTSITFIFLVGVFMSSWLGASVLQLGEWFIKKMPLVSYIYYAMKQISAAINPDQNSHAFKEVAIIKHPRVGEYALAFITSTVTLQSNLGEEELYSVYVPTNHLYLGDIFLVSSRDIMRPNLSVREGIGKMAANFLAGGNSNLRRHFNTSDTDYGRCTSLAFKETWRFWRCISFMSVSRRGLNFGAESEDLKEGLQQKHIESK